MPLSVCPQFTETCFFFFFPKLSYLAGEILHDVSNFFASILVPVHFDPPEVSLEPAAGPLNMPRAVHTPEPL